MQGFTRLNALVAGLAVSVGVAAHAATISYVGSQSNVDPKQTTLPADPDSYGWRNPTPAKTHDIDADNLIGTDGYHMRGAQSYPAYITGFTNISGGGNNFGYMDDPTDPTGIDDFRSGFWGYNNSAYATDLKLLSFVIQGTSLDNKTLRVAVQYDTYSSGSFLFSLVQTVGGSGSATSTTLVAANNGYDFAFFDIVGATAGDKFEVRSSDAPGDVNTIQWHQWGGVAFDSAVPEPASLALLGLAGLGVGRRRR